MNRRIIGACMNPGDVVDDIKRIVVKEIVDEYLKRDEVIYDGNVISAYELEKILKEKMDYLNELCNSNNYVINNFITLDMFGPFSKDEITIIPDFKTVPKIIGFYFENKDEKASIEFEIFLRDDRIIYSIKSYVPSKFYKCDYKRSDIRIAYFGYGTEDEIKINKFLRSFINNNREIILELLTMMKDVTNPDMGLGSNMELVSVQTVLIDNIQLDYLFDIISRKVKFEVKMLDNINRSFDLEAIGMNDYFFNRRDDILKRVSISIDELNPFYRNEIDMYYNSINPVNYKKYTRVK